jgi:membrane protease YdiL (CAAX protease family)
VPLLPLTGLRDLLVLFPVCFVMEEVSSRGALDSHLRQPGEPCRLTSALLGSVLRGVWHLPIVPAATSPGNALGMVLVVAAMHSLVGVPLAVYWRKSGNLAVPAFTHALIDAVRNRLRVIG